MSNTIETINGFPIIATFEFPKRPLTRPGRVIIVDRGESRELGRYVTALQFHGLDPANPELIRDTEWSYGTYANDLQRAFIVFCAKVEQYAGTITLSFA